MVRENMAELLSYAETQKLLDELPREQQKLVTDLIPSQISVGGVQRVLQALLAERVSIRDLPTILEGIQEACAGATRAIPRSSRMCAARLARQISDSHSAPAATSRWSRCRRTGRRRSPKPGRSAGGSATRDGAEQAAEFMQRLRAAFDANSAETPVLLTSGGIRFHVRAIVERIRPNTPVLAQSEIFPAGAHSHAAPTPATLPPGELIDRFGNETGNFFSPKGESFDARALPYVCTRMAYTVYRVTQAIHVQEGKAAPWFGEPGGAEQYETDQPASNLRETGALQAVPGDDSGTGKPSAPCGGS
jgi:hypothetical protein